MTALPPLSILPAFALLFLTDRLSLSGLEIDHLDLSVFRQVESVSA